MSAFAELAPEAALPVQMANAVTGEAPYWDAVSGTLWWLDIQGQRLLGYSPVSGAVRDHRLPLMPGFIAGMAAGGLMLGLEDGLYAFDPRSGLGWRMFAVEADDPQTRLNEGKADTVGRLWFGSMDKSGNGAPVGKLYCLDLDGTVRTERTGIRIPNGICFAPDGKTFYFTDSKSGTVEAIAYDPRAGTAGRSRAFATYEAGDMPDGACIDADGGLWTAVVGGGRIERRRPDGAVSLIVHLAISRPTMPMLGGLDGCTLFVTSQRRFLNGGQLALEPLAGNLLAVRVPHAAAPVNLVRASIR